MLRSISRRLLSGLLVVWGIVTLLFAIFNLLGSPAEAMTDENTDEATRKAVERAYHLDRSLPVQYLYYLNDLSPIGMVDHLEGDAAEIGHLRIAGLGTGKCLALKAPWLRRSFQNNRKVTERLAEHLPGTIVLSIAAMLFAIAMGLPLGVISALKKGRWADRLITFMTLLGISAPSFFMAVLIIRIFAVDLGPWTGLQGSGYLWEENVFSEGYGLRLKNLFLPALALGLRPLSIITQLTRASMDDALAADYVRTAHAKGLSERSVLVRHAFRNALNPVLTSISGWFASLLAGAFFIETIFDWQGLGKLTIDALAAKDYPMILGSAILIGVMFVLINAVVDVLYTVVDPRVR
ncbi:MAG TPA: ABC transporter permease [Bacteroidia bacterium]|jgi:peptide/nickel transport system permease protein|nr:ABC transporter permease [Bacteroidia bacterium]